MRSHAPSTIIRRMKIDNKFAMSDAHFWVFNDSLEVMKSTIKWLWERAAIIMPMKIA
ncbi:hypothetical protein TUM17559_28650 [Enterobacter cloacae]|nr:hypothetical protein TUM17559_28650 [Enterobacter cloacae]GJL13916.1 hypothetical protein TUM17572_37230 [Klebsiella oxytoca]